MFLKTFVFVAVISVVFCKPQLLTFKDGNIGVNFAGYSAQAGLGGFLTGNAAHGGLSASAGTPFGQRAIAGIGGSLDGQNMGGGAFAGATAGHGVGASAGLGGSVGGGGGLAAESHANGVSKSVIKTISSSSSVHQSPGENYHHQQNTEDTEHQENVIQKIKPPKKYFPEQPENHVVSSNFDSRSVIEESSMSESVMKPSQSSSGYNNHQLTPSVNYNYQQGQAEQPQIFVYQKRLRRPHHRRRFYKHKYFAPITYQATGYQNVADVPVHNSGVQVTKRKEITFNNNANTHAVPVSTSYHGGGTKSIEGHFNANAGAGAGGSTFFDGIFNIPIATLRAVNGFLNQGFGGAAGGGISVKKTVEVQHHH